LDPPTAGCRWRSDLVGVPRNRAVVAHLPTLRRIRVGSQPYDVAYGFGYVWASNNGDGTVSKIDPKRGRVVKTIRTGGGPAGFRIAAGSV